MWGLIGTELKLVNATDEEKLTFKFPKLEDLAKKEDTKESDDQKEFKLVLKSNPNLGLVVDETKSVESIDFDTVKLGNVENAITVTVEGD